MEPGNYVTVGLIYQSNVEMRADQYADIFLRIGLHVFMKNNVRHQFDRTNDCRLINVDDEDNRQLQ